MKQLIKHLPTDIKRKVLQKKKSSTTIDDVDDDDDDGDKSSSMDWGRKKKTYWSGDTADLEIGQELQDAEEEEEAVKELHGQKLQRMKESDFYDDDAGDGEDLNDDDDEEEEEEGNDVDEGEENYESILKNKSKSLLKKHRHASSSPEGAGLIGDLVSISLGRKEGLTGSGVSSGVHVEHLSKDLSSMTKAQRLELIASHSPELLGIVSELKDLMVELKDRIAPISSVMKQIHEEGAVQDDVVDYLEVKQQLLLSYCMNVLFYVYMKAQGKSVQNHPVMKQLLKLRYAMEKMRPLDGKLKHQIDRLVSYSTSSSSSSSSSSGGATSGLLRPDPSSLLAAAAGGGVSKQQLSGRRSKQQQDADDSGDNDDDDAVGIYQAPKRTAVPYKDSESQLDKKQQKLEKHRNKLKRSELMDTLREEFGSAPETAASSGLGMRAGDLQKLQEEENERLQFEEDRFIRTTMSRKEKKTIKKRTAEASRLDNFDDIGDIGDFDEIAKLSSIASDGAISAAKRGIDDDGDGSDRLGPDKTSSALQRAVMALSQSDRKQGLVSSYDDDRFNSTITSSSNDKKRRRAPEHDDDDNEDDDNYGGNEDEDVYNDEDDEDDDNLVEDFSQKKKEFLAQKKAYYTAEPKYGGYEDSVGSGGKRAASYEIIKNRGLTPHRKKANRNPRVKKREMYDKAVIRRKGQVRDVIQGAAGAYGGEMTGIKANISRSRKIES